MGLVQYSAKFIPDVASVAKPIQELTRKNVTFKWGEEQQKAFQELKFQLSLRPRHWVTSGLTVGQESLHVHLPWFRCSSWPSTRGDMEGCLVCI